MTTCHAQVLTPRDAFRQMPDSIIPYLTVNDRLDLLDFMDSNMKAIVQNKLGGNSEMLLLTDDSLKLRLSPVQELVLYVLPSKMEVDGSCKIIQLVRKISASRFTKDTEYSYYSVAWRRMEEYGN